MLVVLMMPDATLAAVNTSATRDYNAGIEELVRESFKDIPVMIEIARCESEFIQFHKNGRALHGGTGTMIGLFQISEILHRKTAEKFDWEIDTPEGNMAYARYLYEKNGTAPWLASKHCWNTPVSAARYKAATQAWKEQQALAATAAISTADVLDTLTLADIHTQLTAILEKIVTLQSKQTVAIKTI